MNVEEEKLEMVKNNTTTFYYMGKFVEIRVKNTIKT